MKNLLESEKSRDDAVLGRRMVGRLELLGLELVANFRLSFGDSTGIGI